MRDLNDPTFRASFARRQQQPVDAVPTHLPGLNRLCRDDGGGQGLARGWLVTIGANPGFGKSAMALNLAAQALDRGEPIAYVSLEMTIGQVAARYYAIKYNRPIAKLERGSFDQVAWEEIEANADQLPPLYAPDKIDGRWEDVVAFVKECHEKGCRWMVLDYLQLVQIGDEDNINRAITNVTTDLRAWAANEGVTVVVLSQFNRTTSSEYRARPRCQGLWGGMILEASSDMVLLLDHSRYERDNDKHIARTWLIVDKNRHGPVGDLPVLWDYRTLRMREGLEDEIDDWPK
jgi:replicative DNA helicase